MGFGQSGRRLASTAAVFLLFAAGCVPSSTPPVIPPDGQARPIVSPAAGPAGSFLNVAAPNQECDYQPGAPGYSQYTQLLAGVTIPRTGIVVVQAFQYIGSSLSTYATNDAFVRLRIPPATEPGVYNVLLACQSYSGSYGFAPATFTVTP